MKRVTINDVADAAGVSRQTVSRAVNGKEDISDETRERVLAAVERLNYRPNRLAQGMVTQRSRTVGLEVADVTNPVFAEMVRGAQEVAIEHEYHLLLANSANNHSIALDGLEMMVTQGVDGVIAFMSSIQDDEVIAFAEQFRPLVLINRQLSHHNITSVQIDVERGARLAVTHLLQQGYRAIGILANQYGSLDTARRVRGYRQAMAAAGVTARGEWHAVGEPTLQGGYAAATSLLRRQPELHALFVYNDVMAVGALRACHELGRAVPAQCAIMGFDNIPLGSMVTPSLSSVSYDHYALGQLAMRRVLAMLDEPELTPSPVELPIELVLREST